MSSMMRGHGSRIDWLLACQLITGRARLALLAIEGSGIESLPGQGPAIKAGEFILGYPGEAGVLLPAPLPDVLGRNGTYVAVRNTSREWERSTASCKRTLGLTSSENCSGRS